LVREFVNVLSDLLRISTWIRGSLGSLLAFFVRPDLNSFPNFRFRVISMVFLRCEVLSCSNSTFLLVSRCGISDAELLSLQPDLV
jgi:hypothetical protein